MPDTKITTHKQRFGHVNATNRNAYLNIICIKLHCCIVDMHCKLT